jgi:hypothetical protein
MRVINHLILAAFLLSLVGGCDDSGVENNRPGDCSDGLDNDEDGLTDCEDSDCLSSSECAGDDDDTAGDDDDTAGDDDDTAGDDDDSAGDDDDTAGDDDDSAGDDDDSAGDDDDSVPPCTDADNDNSCAEDDCDDNDPTSYPGAIEACDGVDNDCDSTIDNDVADQDWYIDADGDGFGDENATAESACSAPTVDHVTDNTDCNDDASAGGSIYPGATESCDTIDSDCDGSVVDEDTDTDGDLEPDCTDDDDDGDNDPDSSDCNDTDDSIYTGATETCDGIDNDCTGGIDNGFPDYDTDGTADCVDTDDDDDGVADTSDDCSQGDLGWTSSSTTDFDGDGCQDSGEDTDDDNDGDPDTTDCNDNNAAVNNSAAEVPGNNEDDNCNGTVDEVTAFTFTEIWTQVVNVRCGCHAGSSHSTGFAFNGNQNTLYNVWVGSGGAGVSASQSSLDRIEPGDASASYVMHKLDGTHTSGQQMPRGCSGSSCLDETTRDRIRAWINEGAANN